MIHFISLKSNKTVFFKNHKIKLNQIYFRELCKSLSKIRMLFDNLNGIRAGRIFVSNSKDVKVETVTKIINDLKTTIKGVEWDLQDLDETISNLIID
jgi:hypothetical protein